MTIKIVNQSDHVLKKGGGKASDMELYACLTTPIEVQPLERVLVGTKLALAIPPHCEGQVWSSHRLVRAHGIAVLNNPGTIDADYRGEVKVALINLGTKAYTLQNGDHMARLVIGRVVQGSWREVDELPPVRGRHLW